MSEIATSIGLRTLRANFSAYLRRVQLGATFVITLRGVPVAELRALSTRIAIPRRPGALEGRIAMSDDFDRLPTDILDAFEGRLA